VASFLATNEGLFQTILVYALLAASVQIVMRAGVFSLASIGFWAVGGYLCANLVKVYEVNYLAAIAVTLVVCGVLGWLLALPLRRLRRLYLGMATVAFDLVVVVLATSAGGDFTGGAGGLYAIPKQAGLLHGLIACVVVGYLVYRVESGKWGRSFEALRLDEQVALGVGVPVVRLRDLTFVLSSVVGALSGALYVLTFGIISPEQFGFELITLTLTMVVLGGSNSWIGAYLGAAVLSVLPLVLGPFALWREVAYGALLVVTMVWAPDGVVGVLSRLLTARRRSGGRSWREQPA
jgi:branched-chain amino acid transport system permease protein